MPSWGEVLEELIETQKGGGVADFDGVRRRYLAKLHNDRSERNVVLYASGWLQNGEASPDAVLIGDEDAQAFVEVTDGLDGDRLDLILHSPGGSPEAAEAIVSVLRSRFSHIRVIVPHLAMSAATMIACAADEIVLGTHSFLGPSGPQLDLWTPLGHRAVPARAVLDQFDRAQRESADPQKLPAWLPMLTQYGADLLARCEAGLDMSRDLVRRWLQAYMFRDMDPPSGERRAEEIADWLADYKTFIGYARHIPRTEIEEHGLAVTRLEDDEDLQDMALGAYHAAVHTFDRTPAVKIVESHAGRAFVRQQAVQPTPAA